MHCIGPRHAFLALAGVQAERSQPFTTPAETRP